MFCITYTPTDYKQRSYSISEDGWQFWMSSTKYTVLDCRDDDMVQYDYYEEYLYEICHVYLCKVNHELGIKDEEWGMLVFFYMYRFEEQKQVESIELKVKRWEVKILRNVHFVYEERSLHSRGTLLNGLILTIFYIFDGSWSSASSFQQDEIRICIKF